VSEIGSFERLKIKSPLVRSNVLIRGGLLADELRNRDDLNTINLQGSRALIAVTIGLVEPFSISLFGVSLQIDEDNPGLLSTEVHRFYDGQPDSRCSADTCGAAMMESLAQPQDDEIDKFSSESILVTPYLSIGNGTYLSTVIDEAYKGATGIGGNRPENLSTSRWALRALQYFMNSDHSFNNPMLDSVVELFTQPAIFA
jgi:hypothetical protein